MAFCIRSGISSQPRPDVCHHFPIRFNAWDSGFAPKPPPPHFSQFLRIIFVFLSILELKYPIIKVKGLWVLLKKKKEKKEKAHDDRVMSKDLEEGINKCHIFLLIFFFKKNSN